MTTIASGSLKPAYLEAGKILQKMGHNELLKKELLLATLPTGIMRYAQLVQNTRRDDSSYGDIIFQLKQYIPSLIWKKKEERQHTPGREQNPITINQTRFNQNQPPIGPQQLYDKAGNALDMSKRCNYCQNVKKWRGYGHLEKDCKTKLRETSGNNAPAAKPTKLDLDDIDGGVTLTNNRLFVRMVKINKVGNGRTEWYEYDTGAQVHTTNEAHRLLNPQPCNATIQGHDGHNTKAELIGNIELPEDKKKIYQSLVGSLLYICRHTRPELSIHVNLLGRRTSKPSMTNWDTAMHVLRYLLSTKEEGIRFQEKTKERKIQTEVTAYADASYGGEMSVSQSGSLVILNGINPVIWSSRRQETTAQSVTEAEYIACAETMKDIRWIQQFLPELSIQPLIPKLYTDNEAASKLTKTQAFHLRSRHIEHKYHFTREMVNRGLVEVKGIAGKENPADVLTKLVPMSIIKKWKDQMNGDG